MPSRPSLLTFLVLSAVLALGSAAVAYVRAPEIPSGRSDTSGQFLVAHPKMPANIFAHSVIYVVSHNEGGAMGLIVNRLAGAGPLGKLLEAFGLHSKEQREIKLFLGGPVGVGQGFVLHSDDYAGASTRVLKKGLSLSTGPDILDALAQGRGPRQVRMLFGYAGWSPGQLDGEIARGDWLLAPADTALIFSDQPDAVWEQALKHAGLPL
ncbi:YqgE/AlgH family protein [Methylococcus geothermalis]|uniref:YqgE/AlgH family protein n=1 Tax=Methylococcus geothermalis TaxID=2681310 RepID=UPI001E55E2E5|nr:YqgE/AlgH family protein [Methylococcus geothermalis]